jgi:hypothetical protein
MIIIVHVLLECHGRGGVMMGDGLFVVPRLSLTIVEMETASERTARKKKTMGVKFQTSEFKTIESLI